MYARIPPEREHMFTFRKGTLPYINTKMGAGLMGDPKTASPFKVP
jgi:hypothetical protein